MVRKVGQSELSGDDVVELRRHKTGLERTVEQLLEALSSQSAKHAAAMDEQRLQLSLMCAAVEALTTKGDADREQLKAVTGAMQTMASAMSKPRPFPELEFDLDGTGDIVGVKPKARH